MLLRRHHKPRKKVEQPQPMQKVKTNFDDLTNDELKGLCRESNLKNYSRLNRAQLIALLRESGEENAN